MGVLALGVFQIACYPVTYSFKQLVFLHLCKIYIRCFLILSDNLVSTRVCEYLYQMLVEVLAY